MWFLVRWLLKSNTGMLQGESVWIKLKPKGLSWEERFLRLNEARRLFIAPCCCWQLRCGSWERVNQAQIMPTVVLSSSPCTPPCSQIMKMGCGWINVEGSVSHSPFLPWSTSQPYSGGCCCLSKQRKATAKGFNPRPEKDLPTCDVKYFSVDLERLRLKIFVYISQCDL